MTTRRNLLAEAKAAKAEAICDTGVRRRDLSREQAFEAAFDECSGAVLGFLVNRTGDYHRAQDLAQQVWLYAYERYPTDDFRNLSKLLQKARWLANSDFRSRERSATLGLDAPEVAGVQARAEEAATPRQEAALQKRFWEKFPELDEKADHKAAFWAKHREGLTYEEIAQRFGISLGTAHNWVAGVTKALQDILNREAS
ncbi:MAG: RNA polymerase sigma factor [Opitutales bacterium]